MHTRKVLLYCADDDRRNELRMVLWVRCLWARVEVFRSLAELREQLEMDRSFNCVVLALAGTVDERGELDRMLRDAELAARAIEIRPRRDTAPPVTLAARTVYDGDIARLTEAMLTASARKRGPRKSVAVGVAVVVVGEQAAA